MPAQLTNEEYSDFEFLYAIEDAAQAEGDEDGWTTSAEIAIQVGLSSNTPTRNVGIRLGWAKRYGFVEKSDDGGAVLWRLTEIGNALIHPPKMNAALRRALDSLDPGQRAQITDEIAKELASARREEAHFGRRTWSHRMGGYRDRTIAPQRKKK